MKQRDLYLQEELKEQEIQMQIKMREMELEASKTKTQPSSGTNFDAAKNIKLVPQIIEKNVDKCFSHFEIVAGDFNWP